jgi:hypothetical protein
MSHRKESQKGVTEESQKWVTGRSHIDCGNGPGMDWDSQEHMGTGGMNKESTGKIGTH